LESNTPLGVWTLLYDDGLVLWNVVASDRFKLTTSGWIEACRLLRKEVDLDRRFGILSAHLKALTQSRTDNFAVTSVDEIASAIDLPELWISDAIEGNMAEIIYTRHGAQLINRSVEVPAHFGNPL
jgi:molybdopterin-guanine dinucleotide biosynthesis protein A